MIGYPINFEAKATTNSGINSHWSAHSQEFKLDCGIPTEFEGPGHALSPEDLYAQALTNCFVATFKVFAEKSHLEFSSLSCHGLLTVDLNEAKKPCMKKFKLTVQLTNVSNIDKAKILADKAFKNGFILNSVKTDLTFELLLN